MSARWSSGAKVARILIPLNFRQKTMMNSICAGCSTTTMMRFSMWVTMRSDYLWLISILEGV